MVAVVCVLSSEVLSWLPALLGEDTVAEVRSGSGPRGIIGVEGEFVAPGAMSVIEVCIHDAQIYLLGAPRPMSAATNHAQ